MSVSVQVVTNLFPQLASQFDPMLESALDAGTSACLATSQQLARVDTGRMRADVTIERGNGWRTMTWNAEYSAFNEFGTVNMGAQPFAGPGADEAVPVIQAHLGRFGL